MKWAESKLKEEEQRALKYLETSITTIAPPSNNECTVWKNEKFTLTKKIIRHRGAASLVPGVPVHPQFSEHCHIKMQ